MALVSLVTLTVWSVAPHPADCHDADCGVVAPHDPSGHSIGRELQSSQQPIHCVLCHWTRFFRPSTETARLFVPVVEDDVRVHVVVFRTLQQFAAAQPPLRAPPASLPLA
jgi:hypothetical protein